MMQFVYHLTTRKAWLEAQAFGSYAPDSLSNQGFIHCSGVDQVNRVANAFFSGTPDLVLLEIDPRALLSQVRWEPGEDRPDELFPHIYGPLNLEAVRQVRDYSSDSSGTFPPP